MSLIDMCLLEQVFVFFGQLTHRRIWGKGGYGASLAFFFWGQEQALLGVGLEYTFFLGQNWS